MKLIALDATEAACSAALLDGDQIIQRCITAARQHNEHLLPMLDTLLAEASLSLKQLDGIAFACGPGSFTGVRIAAAVTQGIALAHDLPVVPVSSLRALAQGVFRQQGANHILAGFDARMQEIYWGAYTLDPQGFVQLCNDEHLSSPSELAALFKGSDFIKTYQDNKSDYQPVHTTNWVGAGSAWVSYAASLQTELNLHTSYPTMITQAYDVAYLAADRLADNDYVSPEQALPIYLRNNVAKKSYKLNKALAGFQVGQ